MPISVIWRRSKCLWVGFCLERKKVILEHRLLHRNRNKNGEVELHGMMYVHCSNALKSSHFSHYKCYKNNVSEGNHLNFGTYIT